MSYVVPYRTAQTSTTTGTGAITLAGSLSGYVAFDDALANADTATIVIVAVDLIGIPTGEWEICDTTFTAPDTLSRGTLRGSSTGIRVDFAAGTKRVFAIAPAGYADMSSADLVGILDAANGGTGHNSYADGQLLIGKTDGTLAKATLSSGTGISVTNGDGTITVTNTAPDQTVTLTAGANISISGTYPNFTIGATGLPTGTVTSVAIDPSTTGLTFAGGPITGAGTFTVGGTLAAANGGTGLSSPGTTGNVLTSDGSAWVSGPAPGAPSFLLMNAGIY